jgi:diaminohydroxyphosphoribosylaminopyrimidine deaminase/5-amino-6-(5-phosphoribosylamino)uracil reductase
MPEIDPCFMIRALKLGKRAFKKTGDNPWVGCVIVKNNKILGEGHTQPGGIPHAEAEAIRNAEIRGHSLSGSTLYCTVEPCSFQSRSPSCANTIIEKNISHVVTAIRDPHPKVNGEGIRLLKEAGILVTEGIEEDAARLSLAEWLKGY